MHILKIVLDKLFIFSKSFKHLLHNVEKKKSDISLKLPLFRVPYSISSPSYVVYKTYITFTSEECRFSMNLQKKKKKESRATFWYLSFLLFDKVHFKHIIQLI